MTNDFQVTDETLLAMLAVAGVQAAATTVLPDGEIAWCLTPVPGNDHDSVTELMTVLPLSATLDDWKRAIDRLADVRASQNAKAPAE